MSQEPTKDTFAIFSAHYFPHVGGVEFYTRNLAYALVDKGYRVIVVTNNVYDLALRETDEKGVEIVRLPCRKLLKGRYPVAQKNKDFKQLWDWLVVQPVQNVIVNTRFYPHSLLGISYAEEKKVKPLVIDHGSAHLTLGSRLLDIPVCFVEHASTEKVKTHDVDYYAVSKAGVEWLTHFGIEAKGTLSNSIDAASYRNTASGRNFREELGLKNSDFVVCFTGRFIPEKGITALVQAARALENERVVFLLAGEGPLEKEITEAQLPNVYLLGKLSSSDVAALLLQSDTFCLPSRSEGFSTSLLEAAACGVPAIITKVGGVEELIPSEDYGVVISAPTSAEIEKGIRFYLENPEKRIACGLRVKQRVEEHYSWNNTANQVIAVCQKANNY